MLRFFAIRLLAIIAVGRAPSTTFCHCSSKLQDGIQTLIFMRIRTTFLLALVGLSCSLLALRVCGQQADAGGQSAESDKSVTTLKMQVNEVVLPVTVRDKHGALVNDLQKGDFTLTDEGRPQTIKGFTRDPNLPFRIGLLVDTSRSVSGAMDAERKAAGGFVDL